jgi:preprotein translocase SecE subunit
MVLQSRKKEDEELLNNEEELDQEPDDDGNDASESLSISERRARRKAKRQGTAESALTTPKDAPTRTQEEALKAREKEGRSFLERLPVIGGLIDYFRGVSAEVAKVTWPTREQARLLTSVVLATTVVLSILLGSIDLFYGWWFQRGFDSTSVFIGIAVPVLALLGGLSWYFIFRPETK